MGAPKGNEYWKLRSKHGRDKLFTTPELLWEAAQEYFEWCNNNPWTKTETTVRGDKTEVKNAPTPRPYTLAGLCIYLDASRSWWKEFKKASGKDFLPVLTHIEEIIYTQKFEGAAVGAFKESIIARDLGLVDKRESKNENLNMQMTAQERADKIKEIEVLLKNK